MPPLCPGGIRIQRIVRPAVSDGGLGHKALDERSCGSLRGWGSIHWRRACDRAGAVGDATSRRRSWRRETVVAKSPRAVWLALLIASVGSAQELYVPAAAHTNGAAGW